MNQSKLALLISSDLNLFRDLQPILQRRFQIHVQFFEEILQKNLIAIDSPVFLLWDGSTRSESWTERLLWLRDHFHGCPIFALLKGRSENLSTDLHKMGINLLFDLSSPSFKENLFYSIDAVLSRHNKNGNHNGKNKSLKYHSPKMGNGQDRLDTS